MECLNVREISKAQLVSILENNVCIEYVGKVMVSSQMRLYYRVQGSGPYLYELVYVVE